VGNPPEATSDENSYAEIDDSHTISVPDHSLCLAGREWSGTEILILSERIQYLVTRRRG
jgi:hypothetical protein